VMHEAVPTAAVTQRLLERIERQIGSKRSRHSPPNDPPGKHVNDKGLCKKR
jgi:hypothetical protein